MLSNHNRIKLEINRQNSGKFKNMWKLSNTLLNNQLVKEEITGKFKKYFELHENENTTDQNYGLQLKAVPREKFMTPNVILEKEMSNQ